MKKHHLLICLSVLLVLSIALNCFLILKPGSPSLYLQIAKPMDFDENGEIASEYQILLENREQTEIILLSMINAQPIPEEEAPTALPDGRIWIRYQGTGYPYQLWFYEDCIILGNEINTYRKIQNDHNNPVPLIKELVESISTTFPG